MKQIGIIVDLIAAIGMILVGLGLATSRAVGADSYIQLVANAVGWYMVFRGWFFARSLWLQSTMRDVLTSRVP